MTVYHLVFTDDSWHERTIAICSTPEIAKSLTPIKVTWTEEKFKDGTSWWLTREGFEIHEVQMDKDIS